MIIIEPYVEISKFDGIQILKNIEQAGRVCYKSEGNIDKNSYVKFIKKIAKSGHHSVLEHEKLTVKIICDRGVSHEIVRHRLGSYSQESTRYCNYSKEQFGNEITVIKPFFFLQNKYEDESYRYFLWKEACEWTEKYYFHLIKNGATPQEARSVLPNSLKTEIFVTYNLREWRHFFNLRCAKAAHPQMRQVAIPLLLYLQKQIPIIFDDIQYDKDFDVQNYANIITY